MQTKKIIGVALVAGLVGSMAAVATTSVSAESGLSADGKYDLTSHKLGVIGGFNGWESDIASLTDADDDGIYVGVVKNVAEGDYEFKVRADGAWDDSWGTYEPDYDRTFNSQTNCSISVASESDIVVKLDTNGADANLWNVTYYAVPVVADKATNTEQEAFDASTHTYGAIGGFNSWSDDVALTAADVEGAYSAKIGDLAAGTEFKVRADGAWTYSWGAYEEDYDRTQNSQTNCAVSEDAKDVTVYFSTNGADFQLYPVSFGYFDENGVYKYVDTSVVAENDEQPSTDESSTEESSKNGQSSTGDNEKSQVSKLSNYETTQKDYIFFDNSQTKWDKVDKVGQGLCLLVEYRLYKGN